HRCEQATAFEKTKLMAWTTAEIEDIIMKRPRLSLALLQLLVQRSIDFTLRIESFSVDNIARRLARSLIRFSERLGTVEEDGSVCMTPFTHELLSQYVGTSREIVTQYMNQFRRQGYLRRQQPQLRRGKRIRVQSLHPVGARQVRPGLIRGGRTHHDAVEIFGEPLRQRQPLPSALRAALVVRLRRPRSVVAPRQHLRRFRRHVQRPESEIEQLLTVERETRAGFQRRRMPGIGGRRPEPGFQPFPPAPASPPQPPLPNIYSRPFHAEGKFTSILSSGCAIRLTRQCSGALADVGITVAPITESSRLVRLRSSLHAPAGLRLDASAVSPPNGALHRAA